MPQAFSASKAAMMMACSASADLERAIPGYAHPVEDRTADNAANRGTRKHEILEPIFAMPASEVRQVAELVTYVADVKSRRRFKSLVEHTMVVEWLDSKPKTTADLVLYTQDEIHVLDQKWGKIEVPVFDNHQLLYYAATYAPFAPKARGVTVHIMQPPLGKYESWFIDTTRLGQFMDEARLADKQITDGDLTFAPTDHCQFCPANPHSRGQKGAPGCPAMLQLLYPRVVDEDEILGL